MAKKDAKPRFIRWVLFFQDIDFKIKERKGTKNQVADHLFTLEDEAMVEFGEKAEIFDTYLMSMYCPLLMT